jgi:hypothetical protein
MAVAAHDTTRMTTTVGVTVIASYHPLPRSDTVTGAATEAAERKVGTMVGDEK